MVSNLYDGVSFVDRYIDTFRVADSSESMMKFWSMPRGLQRSSDKHEDFFELAMREHTLYNGEAYRMATFGQLAILLAAAVNDDSKKMNWGTRIVEETLAETSRASMHRENGGLVNRTLVLRDREGIFAFDSFPGLGYQTDLGEYRESLRERLGSVERNGVVYSDDGSVRFTPHGFKTGKQNLEDFSRNNGLIAIVGSESGAEAIAEFSRPRMDGRGYTNDPFLMWVFGEKTNPHLLLPKIGISFAGACIPFFDVDGDSIITPTYRFPDHHHSYGVKVKS